MTYLDDIRARVAASRTAQGLPPVITDPAALERVAAVLATVEARTQSKGVAAR